MQRQQKAGQANSTGKAGQSGPRMVVPKIPISQDGSGAEQRNNRNLTSGKSNRQIVGTTTSPVGSAGDDTPHNKTIESCDDEDFF